MSAWNLSIGKRLAAGLVLILSLAMLITGIALWRLHESAQETQAMMSTPLSKERMALVPFFAADQAAAIKSSSELQKGIEAVVESAEEKALFKDIAAVRKQYSQARDKLIALKKEGHAEAAKEIKTLITRSVEQVEQGSSLLDQATQQNAALVEERAAAAEGLKGQAQQRVQAHGPGRGCSASVCGRRPHQQDRQLRLLGDVVARLAVAGVDGPAMQEGHVAGVLRGEASHDVAVTVGVDRAGVDGGRGAPVPVGVDVAEGVQVRRRVPGPTVC